jgi:hypothetical protein
LNSRIKRVFSFVRNRHFYFSLHTASGSFSGSDSVYDDGTGQGLQIQRNPASMEAGKRSRN